MDKQASHTFSAFWLRSSVVSVLISVKTGISPTGETFSQQFFWGGGVKWACSSLLPKLPRPCITAMSGLPYFYK